tara:strand:+ start:522 stop:650 length:129 start_codon:yes stop_codon:yes gene_type:complete
MMNGTAGHMTGAGLTLIIAGKPFRIITPAERQGLSAIQSGLF